MSKIRFEQLPHELKLLAHDNNGFRMALSRLETGSPETPRSWFYEQKTPDWILEQVESALSGMKDLKSIADWDLDKSSKFGPQGESAPLKDRLEGLEEYFLHLDSPEIVSDPLWKKAKATAIREFGFNRSGSPITSKAVIERGIQGDKYNTNSGYPLWVKRRTPEAQEEAIRDEEIAIEKRFPCVLGTRASMGKTGTSARNIFMASMAVNVHGQRFVEPLQDYIRSRGMQFFLPWEGWDTTQLAISQAWNSNDLKFGADYTKMDQHFNLHHGLEVYDVIKHYFNKKYWDSLKETIVYVFSVPIATNLGYIDQVHAMPSGSEWTNFLETVWNYIFVHYLKLKFHLNFTFASGIGDDQLWMIQGTWTESSIKWIVETVVREFDRCGLPGNAEKQEVSLDKTSFLQRLLTSAWSGIDGSVEAAGVYSLVRNVTSQVYPEFYHNEKVWDATMFALRTIMITENCCQHPLFSWYVKEFVAKSNPHILEFARLQDSKIREIERNSKKIANLMPTYNQEKADTSILSFKTLSLLREVT